MTVRRVAAFIAVAVLLATFAFQLPVDAAGVDSAPPGCGRLCQEGGRISFDHPTWGPSDLVVAWNPSAGLCHFVVVDAAGTERWLHQEPGCRYGARSLFPSADAAGNLFVSYTTERYDGVTILRPTAEGFDDFASLPNIEVGGPTRMRFYDSITFDTDADGDLEIVQVERP